MECLLLRIKPPRAYKHLRVDNLLPLPCPTTVRRLISSMPCTFRFNEESLEFIKWTMSSLDLDLRTLVWNEMSISKSLNFDAQKLRFEGFADYGLDEINADPKAAAVQLVDLS